VGNSSKGTGAIAEESPQCNVGTVSESTCRRNSGTAGKVKTCPYNPWRVLRVAVLTVLSPERLQCPRCLSPLKALLVSGDVGRIPVRGREVPLPGAGPMGTQMPLAGSLGTLKRRGINSLVPNCCSLRLG